MRNEWVGTSESDPILVDFLPDDEVRAAGRLGMTFAPGMWAQSIGGRWERDLAADLEELEGKHGTDVLVSLMEDFEYPHYQIPELLEKDRIGGIEILRFAIMDMGVPEEAQTREFEAMIRTILDRLEDGKTVVVHCRGGLGRTGTVAACALIALGEHTAEKAIAAVRRARKGTVQTTEQEDFVHRFEATLREGGASS